MRRSGWILPGVALALCAAAIGYPALAALSALVAGPGSAAGGAAPSTVRHGVELFLTSTCWAAAVAVAAVLAGWVPGRLLGRPPGRGWYLPLAVLLPLPRCAPAAGCCPRWWAAWPGASASAAPGG